MAKTGSIRAGRAFIELFADDSKLVRGLKQAEARIKAFGAGIRNLGLGMVAVGTAGAAAIGVASKSFAAAGDSMAKMSQRTGISVEALSELEYAAGQSGSSIESVEKAVRIMQRTITEAGTGMQTYVDALAALGLSHEQIKDLSPEEQFKLIGDRISKIEDPTTRAALALKVFGRAGTELLPLLADGAAGIEALQARARALGLTISKEDAEAAVLFGDTVDDLVRVLKRGLFEVGAALAKPLTDLANRMINVAVRVIAWVKANRQLIVTVAKVVAVVAGVGAALIAVGVVISGVGAAIGGVATVITGIGTVLATAGSVIAAVFSALLTPIGATVAAVAGLAAAIVHYTGAGAAAIEWLKARFHSLSADASAAFRVISAAVAAGDLSLAVKVLWAGIKLQWTKGTVFLRETWFGLVHNIRTMWAELKFFLARVMLESWGKIQEIGITAVAGLIAGWTDFTSRFRSLWTKSQTWVEKGFLKLMNLAGALTDEELAAANAIADANRAAELNKIDRERDSKLNALSTAQSVAQEQAAAESKALLDQLAQDREAALAGIDRDTLAAVQSAEDDLARAKREFNDALKTPIQLTIPDKDALKTPIQLTIPDKLDIPDFMDGLDDTLARVEKSIAGRGTFNVEAIQSLQGGDNDAIKENTKRTADATEKVVRELRDQRLAFA